MPRGQPAMNLADRQYRVQRAAEITHRRVADDAHHAPLRVNLDLDDVAAVRKIVEVARIDRAAGRLRAACLPPGWPARARPAAAGQPGRGCRRDDPRPPAPVPSRPCASIARHHGGCRRRAASCRPDGSAAWQWAGSTCRPRSGHRLSRALAVRLVPTAKSAVPSVVSAMLAYSPCAPRGFPSARR